MIFRAGFIHEGNYTAGVLIIRVHLLILHELYSRLVRIYMPKLHTRDSE